MLLLKVAEQDLTAIASSHQSYLRRIIQEPSQYRQERTAQRRVEGRKPNKNKKEETKLAAKVGAAIDTIPSWFY